MYWNTKEELKKKLVRMARFDLLEIKCVSKHVISTSVGKKSKLQHRILSAVKVNLNPNFHVKNDFDVTVLNTHSRSRHYIVNYTNGFCSWCFKRTLTYRATIDALLSYRSPFYFSAVHQFSVISFPLFSIWQLGAKLDTKKNVFVGCRLIAFIC